jgi:hypothetical protein
MSELEIYVKSSALGRSGVHWRKVSAHQQCEEIPDILKKRIIPKKTGGLGTINYLVNETKLSCALVRCDEKLLLEVTGIESPERSNRLGRRVLNSVVWVVDDKSDNEQILRELAARVLMSFWGKYPEFINTISSAVEFDGLEGFKGNFNVIKELAVNEDQSFKRWVSKIERSESDSQEAIWEAQQRHINSDAQIESLAKQLATSPLPEGKDLVVIAEMLTEGVILYKGYRILAKVGNNGQELTQPTLEQYSGKMSNVCQKQESNEALNPPLISDELRQTSVDPPLPDEKKIMLLILASCLLISMSSVWWVLNQRQETSQKIPIPQILISPQPEIPIPQILITPQPQTKPSLPTQPNRRTKPQLQPNQQPRKTP